jgi:hypothetical protein
MDYEDFLPLVESVWNQTMFYGDATKIISSKFKVLRNALKKWAKGHQNLNGTIEDVNNLIYLMDMVVNSGDYLIQNGISKLK